MDQPAEKQKGISKNPFNQSLFVNPENITHGFETYDGFDVRIVYISGETKGEYHIKPADNVNTGQLLQLMKNMIEGAEVNLVDRSGVLNLDFPIYVIVKDPMLVEAMEEVWKSISTELNK